MAQDLPAVPSSPSNRRCPNDWRENIWFGRDELTALPLSTTLRRNVASERSEVALLWNVLRPLVGRGDPTAGALAAPCPEADVSGSRQPTGAAVDLDLLFPPAGGRLTIPLAGAALACWNWPVVGEAALAPVLRALGTVIRRTEANLRRHTEVDAILYRPADRLVVFVEAKLTAPLGVCQAVHGEPDGCRMYRRLLNPAENGCSYWGLGEGGLDFARRFPRRLVEEHLNFTRPDPASPAGADCDRHYQLMRNWLLGQETVRRLGGDHRFCLAVVGDERRLDRDGCRHFAAMIRSGPGSFGLTTWQTIRDGLPGGDPVRGYLEQHAIVTPGGS